MFILPKYFERCGLWLLFTSTLTSKSNPGPRNEKIIKNLSCCNWNVNSLQDYNSLFNHDFICISETYFDSSVIEGNRRFQLNGYNLLRADHPNNTKQGGVCIYYKESLCVREVKL